VSDAVTISRHYFNPYCIEALYYVYEGLHFVIEDFLVEEARMLLTVT
jgi:hypothetical protein